MKSHYVTYTLTLFVCAVILNFKTPQTDTGRFPASESQQAMIEFAVNAGN